MVQPITIAFYLEDLEYLCQQFPHAAIWGQPGVQGGEDVGASASSLAASEAVTDDQQEGPGVDPSAGRPVWAKAKSKRVYGPD